MNKLFNGKGIEMYHILIVIAIIALFIPFKTVNLNYKDFRWIFLDETGKRVDNLNVEGGFGITTIPERLAVGRTLGTNLLAVLPEEYNIYIEFPESEIILTHKTDCESDGVIIKSNNKVYKLENKGIIITTSSLIIESGETSECDWVWFKGERKQSLYNSFMENYRTKVYTIPAEPFAITSPAEIVVEKPENITVPLLALIFIIGLITINKIRR